MSWFGGDGLSQTARSSGPETGDTTATSPPDPDAAAFAICVGEPQIPADRVRVVG
jgi:hypothetical protein